MKKISIVFIVFSMLLCTGCKANEKDVNTNISLTDIHNTVKEAFGEKYLPSMIYDEEIIVNKFSLESSWYEDILAEGTLINVQIDEFVAIKAKSENVDEVLDAMNAYQERLMNDTMQYPMNQAKIKGSKVYKKDDYVFFIMLGVADDENANESNLIKDYENQNQKAIEAIDALFVK